MVRLLLHPTAVQPPPSAHCTRHGSRSGSGASSRLAHPHLNSSACPVTPRRPFFSVSSSSPLHSSDARTHDDSSLLLSSVGFPPPAPPVPLQWGLDRRHILVLNAVSCAAAISASWLFLSAIPTLLAFKRAAESIEKLLDVTREELPDTMAAVRLSGMEISDLTMELSDLGQEITQGVRSSTRAVRLAEERLRCLTTMSPSASVQVQVTPKNKEEGPALARNARNLREGIVKGRAVLGSISALARFSRLAWNFFASRRRKRVL